ncbi:M4 family metallopeptidase [Lentzea sp. E54]|uniref:M4 family metallopeptidase n=1 Tax=Lentzea xerophila TaxID=3435883 RepID=UPI003DA61740
MATWHAVVRKSWWLVALSALVVSVVTAGSSHVFTGKPGLVLRDGAGQVIAVTAEPHQDARDAADVRNTAQRNLGRLRQEFGRPFGALELTSVRDGGAGVVVRARQVFDGAAVEGSEVVQVYDRAGRFVGAVGHVVLSRQGAFAEGVAQEPALRAAAVAAVPAAGPTPPTGLAASAPERVWHVTRPVTGNKDVAVPAYRMEVRGPGPAERWVVLLHASTGEVLDVRAGVPGLAVPVVCEASADAAEPLRCGASATTSDVLSPNGSTVEVDEHLRAAQDFYSRFLRADLDGLIGADHGDGRGTAVRGVVRTCATGPCPSFWNGEQLVFGDTVDDVVVGHEVAHAVFERLVGKPVSPRAREVAEGFADVFGHFAALGSGPEGVRGGGRWLLVDPVTAAVRDMAEPSRSTTPQPASVGDPLWRKDSADPHVNAGVLAKAAQLLTDGGELRGVRVEGLGFSRAAQIWWGAQNYLTPAATFADVANALELSCGVAVNHRVAGVDWEDCDEVAAVITATALDDPAGQ